MKQKYAMVLLIKELMSQLNDIARLKAGGSPARISMEIFRETASVLRELEPELEKLYFSLLPDIVGKSTPKPRKASEKHEEALRAANHRFIKTIKNDLRYVS